MWLGIELGTGQAVRQVDWQQLGQSWHRGPKVDLGPEGPARYLGALDGALQVERALETVRFVDGFYRAPANDGYEEVIDHLKGALSRAGYGGRDPRFELEVWESSVEELAWTPEQASLRMYVSGRRPQVLHEFSQEADVERCMLPVHAPSCDVRGRARLRLEDLEEGEIFVTEAPLRQVAERAAQRGAAAVLSASLATFNVDPSGAQRHLDAIRFTSVDQDVPLPVAQISPRSFERIRLALTEDARVELALKAEVTLKQRPLKTLVATVVGDEKPGEAVVLVSHVQEPGACDNATGVGGLLESAVALHEQLSAGRIDWPARSLAFVWGDEFTQSEVWFARSGRVATAGISADMVGQSPERTGAIALLERHPDPGALHPLPPDEHTPWGANPVEASGLTPNAVSIIARCAMIDVGFRAEGVWHTADHPWEGGSDHDVFIRRGIPGVLFWHFTDFAYHTSLDRMEMVDGQELRRTCLAILATGMALAEPLPSDLGRYLRSLDRECDLRIEKATEAGEEWLAEAWAQWRRGAHAWLRAECLPGVEHGEPIPELPAQEGEPGEAGGGAGDSGDA